MLCMHMSCSLLRCCTLSQLKRSGFSASCASAHHEQWVSTCRHCCVPLPSVHVPCSGMLALCAVSTVLWCARWFKCCRLLLGTQAVAVHQSFVCCASAACWPCRQACAFPVSHLWSLGMLLPGDSSGCLSTPTKPITARRTCECLHCQCAYHAVSTSCLDTRDALSTLTVLAEVFFSLSSSVLFCCCRLLLRFCSVLQQTSCGQ